MTVQLTQPDRQRWWRSIRWSAVLHVGVMLTMLLQALWIPAIVPQASSASRSTVELAAIEIVEQPAEFSMAIESHGWLTDQVNDLSLAAIDLSDPRWDDILSEPQRAFEANRLHEHDTAERAARSLVVEQLKQSIAASESQSSEANLESLNKLGGRLNAVSSTGGVDEVSGTVARLTGTMPRAAKLNEAAAGPFDFSTAQAHDCLKEVAPDGTIRYRVVMIDAAGRTTEVDIDREAGEQLYNTLQIVKSNPLLERVYRGIVMGLMDKLLQGK